MFTFDLRMGATVNPFHPADGTVGARQDGGWSGFFGCDLFQAET
jgi:hypothetical protein